MPLFSLMNLLGYSGVPRSWYRLLNKSFETNKNIPFKKKSDSFLFFFLNLLGNDNPWLPYIRNDGFPDQLADDNIEALQQLLNDQHEHKPDDTIVYREISNRIFRLNHIVHNMTIRLHDPSILFL